MGDRIWELTPQEYQEYRLECLQMHREWMLDRAFRAAVKQKDTREILRLAPKFVKIVGRCEDGEFVPPRRQPQNFEEYKRDWKIK